LLANIISHDMLHNIIYVFHAIPLHAEHDVTCPIYFQELQLLNIPTSAIHCPLIIGKYPNNPQI